CAAAASMENEGRGSWAGAASSWHAVRLTGLARTSSTPIHRPIRTRAIIAGVARVRRMDFAPSARAADLRERVAAFMAEHIEPIEDGYHRDLAQARLDGTQWTPLPVLEELKAKAREQGLWNLFLPRAHAGDYAAKYGTDRGQGPTNAQ